MAVGFDIKVLGIEQLLKKLRKETIKEPVDEGIKKATLWTERTVKVSTPVDESRLRPSMTHQIIGQTGRVGTIVPYALFVEYGHKQTPGRYVPAIGKRLVKSWVEPRHVIEGSSIRILGKGMFTYTMELLKEKINEFITDMGKAIVARFG